METTVAIATVLRPIVTPIFFFLVVAPIAWLLYRAFPPGRLKVFLFRERTGPDATIRDKWLIGLAVVLFYVVFIGALVMVDTAY